MATKPKKATSGAMRRLLEARIVSQVKDELALDNEGVPLEEPLPPAQSGKVRTIPWARLELWYVTNAFVSFTDVAKKFNVPASYVRTHACKHGWRTKQDAFRAEVWRRVQSSLAARLAAQISDVAPAFVDSVMQAGATLTERARFDAMRADNDLPPESSYEKTMEWRGKGNKAREVEVITRRRRANIGNPLNRTILRMCADFVLKFGGFQQTEPSERNRDRIENQPAPTTEGPSGTAQDFQASFTSALGVMLGPGVAAAAAARATTPEQKP